jgi:hypothetical protein
MTNAPFGWDAFGATGPRVTIAVLDTKIDPTHPDFVNSDGSSQLDLAGARDWVPPARQSGFAAYHGTFVAGLAAASTGNGRDAASIGHPARILPLTVVDGSGATDAATLADAILYAWQRGARVINLSLGISGDSAAVRDAIRLATTSDDGWAESPVVAAAGNNTGSAPFYPGSYPEAMSVSGTDANDRRAPCSNYNANVSVSAPADRLVGLAPMPGERIQAPCGTSAATPQVSGLAAMLFMQDPSRAPLQVRRVIERSADDLGSPGRDDEFGAGRIDAERALRAIGPATTGARASATAASGASTITATASSPHGVQRAQLVFDRPDAAPVELRASDGALGGTTEVLAAWLPIPAGTTPGPHPIWVRAFDGTEWGPATVAVLGVDGRAPTITGAAATNAVRATGQPVTVTFTATDDYSSTVSFGVEFRSQATNQIVFTTTRIGVPAGAQRAAWLPPLSVPGGPYRVKIAVADASGNVSQIEVGTVVT